MNNRSTIAKTTLAAVCIASSLFFGGLALLAISAEGPQSIGRLPVNVHSAAAHGLTVPGAIPLVTAQANE